MKGPVLEFFKRYADTFTVGLAGLLLIFQFAHYCGILGLTATHRGVVVAFDDDGAMIIDRAVKTRWYKDNGVASYGPLYFRLAHSLARAIGAEPLPTDSSERHAVERSHHFVLMVMSLLAVFLLAGLLAWVLRQSRIERVVLTICLVAALLSSTEWSRFVFRAHPDLLFAFFAALASYLTFLSLDHPEQENYARGSAAVWGLAVATKLTIVLYIPAFLILWMPPFSRARAMKTLRYFGWMFLSYFIVCFPQSIVLDRPVRFLLQQSQYGTTPTLDSLLEWLKLNGEQIWLPLAVISVAALSFQGRGERCFDWRKSSHRRFALFVILPFIMLLSRKVTSSHDYYPIPFVAGLLLLAALVGAGIRGRLKWAPLVLLVALCFWPKLVPATFYQVYADQNQCRPEAAELEMILSAKIHAGRKIYIDPYVPLDQGEFPAQVGFTWQISWAQVKAFAPQVIVLNQKFLRQYFDMDTNPELKKYIQSYNSTWEQTQSFYRRFGQGGERVVDEDGGEWTKSYDHCNWVMWEKR